MSNLPRPSHYRPRYYDREGEEIDRDRWCELFEDLSYRHIAITAVGSAEISTVRLGLDHRLLAGGEPLIFETLVFGGEDDGSMFRCSTEAEARAAHEFAVAHLKSQRHENARLDPPDDGS